MEIIEQQYKVPDGNGGFTVRHFETSSNVVKMSDGETLEERFNTLHKKVKKLNSEAMTPTRNAVKSILNNDYVSSGSTGEGEYNGVPTRSEVAAILNGTYTHTDKTLDEFAPEDVITQDDVKKILNGNY